MDLTQEEVAEKIHVSRQTISNWETGRTLPDITSLVLISDIYNISLDELIKENDIIMDEIKVDQKRLERYKIIKKLVIISCLF